MAKAASLFRTQPSDDGYPNDRLPSEQIVPTFALRGYQGPEVMVSAAPYFKALRVTAFLKQHARDMQIRKSVAPELLERDLIRLEDLANASDAVLVVPSW